jgi:hypothetical protein
MEIFKKALSWFLFVIVFIVLVGVGFEFALRVYTRDVEKSYWKTAMMDHVQARIDKLWEKGRENKPIFWGPPYTIFWNEGLDDEKRMQEIYKHSILPKSGEWITPNFLRNPKEAKDHSFVVKTNSLGFRDKERQIEKPENTKRIIVLGSYPAFGHGVDNDQTYSAQLEKILNEKYPQHNFEVWNGGQQGTVAIMGYARLKYEIHKYDPDLIIFDYGWVDLFMRQDQTAEASEVPVWKKPKWTTFQKLAAKIRHEWLPRTSISKVIDNQAKKSFWELNIAQWKKVMKKTVEFSKKYDVPFLYIRNFRETLWWTYYKEFERPKEGLYFLDTTPAFDDKLLTDERINEFWSKKNWLHELGETKESVPKEASIYFKVDALQFNEFGHNEIAKLMAKEVEKILKL